ncbi:MAG: hypothetical protein KGL39_01625 [Patescibacteria group bacterium]|nr:hypothetical protein [Patescibacteria group bacterium]
MLAIIRFNLRIEFEYMNPGEYGMRRAEKKADVRPAGQRQDAKDLAGRANEALNPFIGEDYAPTKTYGPIAEVKNDDLTPYDMIAVVTAAIDNAGLVGHNLRSFNRLLDGGLRQIATTLFRADRVIKNERGQTPRDQLHESTRLQVTFSDLKVGTPMYNSYPLGNPMQLYPNMARESGLAFTGPVSLSATVTLTARYKDGTEATKTREIEEFTATQFPIMRGCVRCPTHGMSRELLKNIQEDPNDPSGYFIAKSQEWTVDLLENIRFNTLHVHLAMVANEHVRGEFISQPGGPFENSSQVIIRYMTNGQLTIEINSMKLSKARIPFYLVYRLFGTTSDRAIVQTVVADPAAAGPGTAEARTLGVLEGALQLADAAFAELKDVIDQAAIVQRLAEKLSRYLTNPGAHQTNESAIQYLNADLLNIFDRNLLPHMGVTQESRGRKLRVLGQFIAEILAVHAGIVPPTDRDALPNKRVHGAGVSLAKAFKTQFNTSILVPAVRAFKRELKNNSFDGITQNHIKETFRNAIVMPDFVRAMTHVLTAGSKPIIIRRRAVTSRVSSQVLERKNGLNVISSLRTITTHGASNASKQTERADMMRRVHATLPGYVCVSQSADTGENVGMRKQLALTASVCDAEDATLLELALLADREFVVPFDDVTDLEIARDQLAKVYVNGKLVGVCRRGRHGYELARRYRLLRREGRVVTHKTTIEWSVTTNKVNFLLDVGRLVRPLLIVDSNVDEYDAACREAHRTGDASKKVKFVQNIRLTRTHVTGILAGEVTLHDLVMEGIVEFITPEEAENCLLAESIDDLRRHRHNAAMQFTHCDIPQAILGFAAHLSPFANHTQPARVTYETNQGRQTGGWYALSWPFRADKNRFFQVYNEVPMVRTITNKYIPANGVNITLAYLSYGGDNMEDSVIVSKAAVDRGLFEGIFFRFEKAELEKGEKFCTPDPLTTDRLKPSATYEYLEDGSIKVGTIVRKGYVLIGRVKEMRGRVGVGVESKYQFIDRSVVYQHDEPAVVTAVVHSRGANDETFRLVKLRFFRPLRKGDKTSTRAGNKSIVALMLPQEDLPFDDEGNTPDFIINCHCLPSRMVVGQMLETQMATICARKGVIADGTAFLPIDADQLCEEMEKLGYRSNGRKRLYNGATGNYFDAAIFVGTTYEQRLQKFVNDDEYVVGGTGPTDATTGQPLAGKNVHGGLRVGEMEAWGLAAHGCCMSWIEKFSEDSDGRPDFRCRCGLRAIFNERNEIYQCKACKENADISRVDSSKSAIVLQEELSASNIKLSVGLRPREFEVYAGAQGKADEKERAADEKERPADEKERPAEEKGQRGEDGATNKPKRGRGDDSFDDLVDYLL